MNGMSRIPPTWRRPGRRAQAMARRIRCALRLQQLAGADARPGEGSRSAEGIVSLAKCRELLGDEAAGVSDEDLDLVRRHAAAMAHVLLLAILEDGSTG